MVKTTTEDKLVNTFKTIEDRVRKVCLLFTIKILLYQLIAIAEN